jgi:hypothetical protein
MSIRSPKMASLRKASPRDREVYDLFHADEGTTLESLARRLEMKSEDVAECIERVKTDRAMRLGLRSALTANLSRAQT